jgi:hypothetical protein
MRELKLYRGGLLQRECMAHLWDRHLIIPNRLISSFVRDLVRTFLFSVLPICERRSEFHIPLDIMPGSVQPDHRTIWLTRVNLKVKDFIPLTETYAIHVTPEVHTL